MPDAVSDRPTAGAASVAASVATVHPWNAPGAGTGEHGQVVRPRWGVLAPAPSSRPEAPATAAWHAAPGWRAAALVSVVAAVLVPALVVGGSGSAAAVGSRNGSVVATSAVVLSAHRGGSDAPDNSLAAFRWSFSRGFRDVEADAVVLRDGVVALFHDATVPATCSGELGATVSTLSWAQLSGITCGGQPVARLVDLLAIAKQVPARTMRVEVKHSAAHATAKRRADAAVVAREVRASGLSASTVVQDFSWASTTATVKGVDPTLRVSALMASPTTTALRSAKAAGAYDASYPHVAATRVLGLYARQLGLVPTVWTVDSLGDARVAAGRYARVLISDHPEALATLRSTPVTCAFRTVDVPDRALLPSPTPVTYSRRAYPAVPVVHRQSERVVVRLTARSASRTTVYLGPMGASLTKTYEVPVTVSGSTTATVDVPRGDTGKVRVRTSGVRADVRLTMTHERRLACTAA